MQEIINWCNTNNGFLTGILAILSLFISVIAVFISILTARLPYKKKVKITCGRYFTTPYGENGINVGAVNVGQLPVRISMMGLLIRGNQYFQPDRINGCKKLLTHAEDAEILLELQELKNILNRHKIARNEKVYAFMRDSEGHSYKRFFKKAGDILSW